jgi:bacteriorhodopsin
MASDTGEWKNTWLATSVTALQIATAAMLGGTLISFAAAIARVSYTSTLSCGICGVAYIHYAMMSKRKMSLTRSDSAANANSYRIVNRHITLLRYSDWGVTMPLLALDLLNKARNGGTDLDDILGNEYIPTLVAGLAVLMIAFGGLPVLLWGEISDYEKYKAQPLRIVSYFVGLGCLGGLYSILFLTALQSDSTEQNEVFGFAMVWVCYPIVYLLDMMCGNAADAPEKKDVAFAVLDVVSKAFLSLYTVLHAFA